MGNCQKSLHLTRIKKENSEASCSQQESDYLNPVYQAEQENEGFSLEKKIVDALCHLVKQQSAPDIELDVFDGNPLVWPIISGDDEGYQRFYNFLRKF